MIKLSFIVPVYNVTPYLRKCVDSLLAQDYDDYEIILVDDGSTDNSPQICDEYAEKGPPVRVIHQANAGLSAARNAGIKAAEGKYLCFVDSDDYWEPNVLDGLMEQVERDDLDVLRFKYRNVNERYEVFNPNKSDPYRNDDYSGEVTDGVTFLNTRFGTACYAVMFILRRNLIVPTDSTTNNSFPLRVKSFARSNVQRTLVEQNGVGLFFTPGIYFEDTDWTPRMLIRAKRVASTDTIVYNYLVRQGSITKAVEQSKKQKVLDDKMRLIGEMQRQAKDLQEKGLSNTWFSRMIADTVISVIGMLSTDFYSNRKAYLAQLTSMGVFPVQSANPKARLINLSPRLAVELLHWKRKVMGESGIGNW